MKGPWWLAIAWTAAALTISLRPLPAAGDAAPDLREKVAVLEDARRAAMVSGDEKALENLFAEDCTYVHSNGLIQSRGDLIAMLTRGDLRYLSFDVEKVEYRSYGGVVVGTGSQTIQLTNAGKPFTSRSRYTVVYADAGGGLKLVAYQSTSLPEVVMEEKKP